MRKMSAAAIGVVLATMASAAPAPWLEIKSQHFTVITNSSEKEGRRAAWQFEQIRQALRVIWPWAAIDGGKPIAIFAVRDEATLKSLGPQYWEGRRYRPASFWVGGADRQYIALRTDISEPDDAGSNPYQAIYWNYVSLVFHRSMPAGVPAWYGRGVAEVLSNTIVREKEIHVGRLMNGNLQSVRETALIPMSEFLAADRNSRYLTSEVDAALFDAQAWAFVHYLMFGNQGEHSGRVSRFNQLLMQGATSEAAMKAAFGPDMTPYFTGMREYVRKAIFQYARIPVALDLKPEGFASRPLPAAESALLRASLLVAMNRPVEARAMAAEALKAEPSTPGVFEIEGQLLDRERKAAEAREAFGKAIAQGSKRAQVYYRLAQLSWPEGGADDATNAKLAGLLEKAIELEPDFASALSFLADIRADQSRGVEAVGLAEKAMKLEPNVPYHRLALARALWNSDRQEDAVAAARSALAVADTPEERDSAQRFLDFAARARPAATPFLAGRTGKSDAATALALLQAPCDGGNGEACRILKSLPPRD
ncbi:MAG: hypothetical protein K1Y01_16340 [Vicinamibacteria bacterium]|nr:hypothetical protein [Vicinamibacteria bacterium]